LTEAVHGAGWRVDAVATVEHAREAVAVAAYDLLLVDLGLPDGDGLDLVREFRRRGVKTPILILTARSAIEERISGLDAGADDYLVKPFNTGELLARCRALLRRAPDTKTPIFSVARLSLDVAAGLASSANVDIGLAPRERTVLEILIREAGRVVPKRKLEHALSEFCERNLSLTIAALRWRQFEASAICSARSSHDQGTALARRNRHSEDCFLRRAGDVGPTRRCRRSNVV
jgi:DNA-binding response OmpR family regulator